MPKTDVYFTRRLNLVVTEELYEQLQKAVAKGAEKSVSALVRDVLEAVFMPSTSKPRS